MDTQAFSFNSNAKYQAGGAYSAKDLAKQLTNPSIQVQTSGAFQTTCPDVFQKYQLPNVSSDKLVQAWHSSPMQFWQNQVNFAIWCATTGSGVSAQDHLSAGDPLMRSLYLFHVYYQVRRILDELQAPLPQDQAWGTFNNPYDRRAYERICSEFGVSPHTAWHIKGLNHGLGRVYNYWTHKGYHPVGAGDYDPARMSFTQKTTNAVLHVDYIKQDSPNVEDAWSTFILDKSQGFTRPGVERLNDSIRTYVWTVLGAQAQTRTRILGAGTVFDAQKQFLVNLEDAVSSPVDLPSAIKRYQDVLQYAGSEVNFVFGIGLYMAPCDMLLRIGQVVGYNNEIMIATSAQSLGFNMDVNTVPTPPTPHTGETGLPVPKEQFAPRMGEQPPAASTEATRHAKGRTLGDGEDAAEMVAMAREHADEKTALVVGGVAVGLLALWLVTK